MTDRVLRIAAATATPHSHSHVSVWHAVYLSHVLNRVRTVGVGQVIPGWDKGVAGMCVSEKRILTIPSNLAYGKSVELVRMRLSFTSFQGQEASATPFPRILRWSSR